MPPIRSATAARHARQRARRELLAQWEAEHGPIDDAEVQAMREYDDLDDPRRRRARFS